MQNTDKDWTYDILPIIGNTHYKLFDVFETYEEAELACLKQLIEIVNKPINKMFRFIFIIVLVAVLAAILYFVGKGIHSLLSKSQASNLEEDLKKENKQNKQSNN